MAYSPTINGQALCLRPFGCDLISARYIGWLNDPVLMQYSRQRFLKHSVASCEAFANSFDNNSPSFFWAILAKEPTLGHIGNLTAIVDANNRVAELTIMIGERNAHGKGLGLEAWQLAMDYLVEHAGIRKIAAGTMALNIPMIKIMQKTGMFEDGLRSRHFLYQDREVDCVMFAKFACLP